MNWQALGAVGELLGAVGVIVTLIYVGLQVRQNTSAIKAAAIQDMSASTTDYLNAWSTDEHLPGLIFRVTRGALPKDLTDDENARLFLAFTSMLRVYEARYLQIQLGVIEETILDSMAGAAQLLARPWFKEMWEQGFEPQVGRDFALFVRKRFEIG